MRKPVCAGAHRANSPGDPPAPAVGAEQFGPEGIDPNLVASYLDNELDSDAVAEYEKKCLSHDVVLAEVASVHQILSLLGHKVKVPAAARSRMYQLVKGREATGNRGWEDPRRFAGAAEHADQPVGRCRVPRPRGSSVLVPGRVPALDRSCKFHGLEELDGRAAGRLPADAA